MSAAPCAGKTDLFFSYETRDLKISREICAGCPMKRECRDGAMERRESHGVWGGRTAEELLSERRRMQRRRRMQMAS